VKIGLVIIGDEILSGRRKDRHFEKSIEILHARGLKNEWVIYLPDSPELLRSTFQRTLASGDAVFSFGGIGATPDDYTRQAVADALELDLVIHPDAKLEIEGQFGHDAYPNRIKMGMFPNGSRIIPNEFNRIPGFSIKQHHFLPGFPSMAWSMMEWVLDNEYIEHHVMDRDIERSVLIFDVPESSLIPLMDECLDKYPGCKVFSLPTLTAERLRRVELGVKGTKAIVDEAFIHLQKMVSRLECEWNELPPRL
jgi:molybdopterin-biosynthesis enzyme MoeA-like protein